MLKIVQAPNTVLSQSAKPINNIDKSIHHLINQMKETLVSAKDPEGVGLAAPQVGKSLQLFIIKQTARSEILVFINPQIEKFVNEEPAEEKKASASKAERDAGAVPGNDGNQQEEKPEKSVQLEGCLSLNKIWGVVKRHPGLVLSYQDEEGQKHKKKFNGFIATIIQHEYDHLQGILFPKRVLEQKNPLYKSIKNEKGEVEFEEIKL